MCKKMIYLKFLRRSYLVTGELESSHVIALDGPLPGRSTERRARVVTCKCTVVLNKPSSQIAV